jgi:predicted DNA-binding ribbon-helix-helix protein
MTVMPPALPFPDRTQTSRRINSLVIKRSIIRGGHKSSVSLEDPFWDGLRAIAARENVTVSRLVETIDHGRNRRNLSSAIRVFVLDHFRRNSQQKLPNARSDVDSPAPGTIAPPLANTAGK